MQRAAGRPSLAAICDRVPTRTRDAQRKSSRHTGRRRPTAAHGLGSLRRLAVTGRCAACAVWQEDICGRYVG
jgi:hypothetical protein